MSTFELLQLFVYAVFIFSIVAYAALDGFDLGVGCLHLFARGDQERRLMINAIGPVWDGNTTWIVIGSGVLFAGFPKVFSAMMAGFYTPVMILLFGFMLRGAAVEFRGKRPEKRWRTGWDISFFVASLLLALTFGMLLGILIEGLPLTKQEFFQIDFAHLFRPYPLLVSLLGLSLFTMHGSIYLLMKTEGRLHNQFRIWVKKLIALFLFFWILTSVATFIYQPRMIEPFFNHHWLLFFPAISLFSIFAIPRAIAKRNDGWAFIASSSAIVFLLILFAIGTFPYLIYSTLDPTNLSMTLFNSSGSLITMTVLTIISLSGVPLSIFYGSYVYKVFKGKIKLDSMSY